MTTCVANEWDSEKPIFPVRPISKIMLEVVKMIMQVAEASSSVLIVGETGTGKEGVAKAIHQKSSRAGNPFVAVNCAEFSETVVESELFGHGKGAYTGATSMRCGLFERADKGTLFLDEIGDLSLAVQAKVLRAIQEGEVRKVGTDKLISLDLRFIAATNKNLIEEIKHGRFREDLYHRLAGFPIVLPPLRHRKEDLPGLIAYFLDNPHILRVPKRCTINSAAREVLLQRAWQDGNIRELMNVLSAAVIRCPNDTIMPEHLSPPASYQQWFDRDPGAELVYEKDRLLSLLEKHEWNFLKVAAELGCSKRTVFRKIKKYGLKRKAHALSV